jgi:hypothetical protein
VGICVGPYGSLEGVAFFYEQSTPVQEGSMRLKAERFKIKHLFRTGVHRISQKQRPPRTLLVRERKMHSFWIERNMAAMYRITSLIQNSPPLGPQ